jgi:CheY-like chemotaxis protein
VIRVLVADDDERDRSWMSTLLERVGFDVREAESGVEAVAVVDVYRPHLALVVIHAAARDGGSALRAIRGRPAGRKSAIVALVPPSTGDGRDSAIDGAADGWLMKPCSEAALLDEVQRRLGIAYRYADTSLEVRGSVPPDPAELGHMPFHTIDAQVQSGLLAALRVADYEGLLAAVDQIAPEQAEMASALRGLAEAYAYEVIEELLREPGAPSSS